MLLACVGLRAVVTQGGGEAGGGRRRDRQRARRAVLRGASGEVRPGRAGAREPRPPGRRRALVPRQGVQLRLGPVSLLRVPVQRPPGKSTCSGELTC